MFAQLTSKYHWTAMNMIKLESSNIQIDFHLEYRWTSLQQVSQRCAIKSTSHPIGLDIPTQVKSRKSKPLSFGELDVIGCLLKPCYMVSLNLNKELASQFLILNEEVYKGSLCSNGSSLQFNKLSNYLKITNRYNNEGSDNPNHL